MVYAKCLFCCEKYEKCLEITKEIIEFGMSYSGITALANKDEKEQEVLTVMTEVLLKLGRIEEAEKEALKTYEELFEQYGGKINASSINYLFEFGKILHVEGYFDIAIKYLEKV